MMRSAPTSRYSKLQQCISTSTAESEYYIINECTKQCLWYKKSFKELNINLGCITTNWIIKPLSLIVTTIQ